MREPFRPKTKRAALFRERPKLPLGEMKRRRSLERDAKTRSPGRVRDVEIAANVKVDRAFISAAADFDRHTIVDVLGYAEIVVPAIALAFSGDESEICACLRVVETSAGEVRQTKRTVEIGQCRRGIVRQRAFDADKAKRCVVARSARLNTERAEVDAKRAFMAGALIERDSAAESRNVSVVEACAKRAVSFSVGVGDCDRCEQRADERELMDLQNKPPDVKSVRGICAKGKLDSTPNEAFTLPALCGERNENGQPPKKRADL